MDQRQLRWETDDSTVAILDNSENPIEMMVVLFVAWILAVL